MLITGRTHKPVVFPTCKLSFDPQNRQARQKQFYNVTASSWLDYGGYAMRKMLTPCAQTLQENRLSSYKKTIRVTL